MVTRRTLLAGLALGTLAATGRPRHRPSFRCARSHSSCPFRRAAQPISSTRAVTAKIGDISRSTAGNRKSRRLWRNTSTASTAARAEPDGYTLLMGTAATHAINPALYPLDILRPGRRLRANLAAGGRAQRPRGPSRLPGQGHRPTDRPASRRIPGKYSYASAGVGTPGPSVRRAVQVHGGRGHGALALQGRRPGAGRCDGEGYVPMMFDNLPSSTEPDRGSASCAVSPSRRTQRAPRCPICRRWPSRDCPDSRPTAGMPCSRLWGHPARRGREAERGRRRGPRRSRAWRPSWRISGPRWSVRPRSSLRRMCGPSSRGGLRWSRRRAPKSSNEAHYL